MMKIKEEMPEAMMEAVYRVPTIKDHRGNPLLEALPPFIEANEISDKFGRFPSITASERLLPRADRTLLVSRLNIYLEPLPSHYEVIEKINLIIRAGYIFRNPLDPAHRKTRTKRYHKAMKGDICAIEESGPSTAPSFALFGTSGVGKSTVADRTLSFLPRVLKHSKYQFTQVVWLKVDCPLDGSLKQLLLSILDKLDHLLGSGYRKEAGTHSTIDSLILSVANIAEMHNLGVLVIDEIQNLLDASGVGQSKMLNFFVAFANAKIPVVTIGTPRAMQMLTGTFREARRVGDHGTCVWDCLDEKKEWKFFIKALWKYQWTEKYIPLTDELSSVMKNRTQGIHALVVRLFQLTQLEAFRRGLPGITTGLINEVADDKFKLVEPMLQALRKKNKKAIANYQDLLDKGISDLTKQLDVDAKLELLESSAEKRDRDNERMNAACALVAMKFDADKAQEILGMLFNMHPGLTAERAVRLVLDAAQNKKINGNADSLAEIVGDGTKSSAVDALADAGLIETEQVEKA